MRCWRWEESFTLYTFYTLLVWNVLHQWCFTWKDLMLRTALHLNFGWIEAIITLCMNIDLDCKSMMGIFTTELTALTSTSCNEALLKASLSIYHPVLPFVESGCGVTGLNPTTVDSWFSAVLSSVLWCSLFDLPCFLEVQLQKNKFLIGNNNHNSAYKVAFMD